jgi:hypothetical protein
MRNVLDMTMMKAGAMGGSLHIAMATKTTKTP